MLKLYKQVDNEIHYWETWDKDEKTGVVHWGVVGQRGQDKEIKSGFFSNFRKEIQKEVDKKISEGYDEIEEDNLFTLLIEFQVEGMGTPEDVEKRTRLQNKMDGVLGWTGLGHCDGGSIGSGTMEVCCFVVDFDIAKKVIETKLKDTEFADYTRIFDENEEEN
jgi:predicted DNA-binding WGR domain protein